MDDFLKAGVLKNANPNFYGMIESIVCSRAKVILLPTNIHTLPHSGVALPHVRVQPLKPWFQTKV